jgi:moderate conductance mechanosensitive channel
MTNLWFSTIESSLLTVGVIIVIGIIFMIEKRIISNREDVIKKYFLFLIYFLSLIMMIGALVVIMWFWDIDVVVLLGETWISFTLFLEDSIGRAIASTAVIFFSLFIIKFSKVGLKKIGQKPSPNQRRKRTISKITSSIIKYIVGIFAILSVLAIWGVNVLPALAGLGILGLVLGFGAQKFINDLISGFFIVFEHHYDVGDKIEVQGFKGEVIDIGLKTTKIRNFKGEVKIVSNGEISNLINFSQSYSLALVEFGIAYKEDIQTTIDLLNAELPKLVKELPALIEAPVVLGVTDLANSSVNLRVMAKTLNEEHYGIERKMRQRIKEILDANDIEIPFPQIVVNQPNPK